MFFLLNSPSLKDRNNAVLITGASTGIGYDLTATLASLGCTVFATVRTQTDAHRIEELGANVRPLIMDVRNVETIKESSRRVQQWLDELGEFDQPLGRKLVGVVLNAAVSLVGPLELMDMKTVQMVFETNVTGCVWVASAFLPFLRQAAKASNLSEPISPRLVFVSSLAAELAVPGNSIYASSKLALNYIARILRQEVRNDRIEVAVIVPGAIKTPIWDKVAKDMSVLKEVSESSSPLPDHYATLFQKYETIHHITNRTAVPASDVTKKIVDALQRRWWASGTYLVGWDAYALHGIHMLVPEWFWDLGVRIALWFI